jgi:translation initiation factor 1
MAHDRNAKLAYSTGPAPAPAPAPPEAAGAARAAGGKGVRISVERRPGGRLTTAVRGLVGTPAALDATARALKAACGAGGSVQGDTIELQGDQADGVQRALAGQGIKSRISR